jgi:hypothetical protein
MDKQTDAITTAYQIRLSENAIQNIDEITGYIAFIKHQPMNAIKVGDAFLTLLGKFKKIHMGIKNADLFQLNQKCIAKSSALAGISYIKL